MTQPSGHFVPPTRMGVGPSCVGLPVGPWPTMLDFLSERFTGIRRERWQARIMAGEVWDEHGATGRKCGLSTTSRCASRNRMRASKGMAGSSATSR